MLRPSPSRPFHFSALLACALLAQACTSASPLGPGSITGLVMDLGTGVGIPSAAVSAAGKSTTTDARGYFTLDGLASGPVTVTVTKTGFAPAYATPRASDKPESTRVAMKKQGTAQSYSPTAARTLSQTTEAGPYAVTFLANSLDSTDANLKVSITPVDPTKEASVLPGSLVTTSDSVLDPVTFAEFSILDSAGNRVQLKSGQSATVELPIPVKLRGTYPLDSKIHCYAFNPTTGAWDDFVDGTVRASSVDHTTPVLAAAIKHFSWYGGAPQGNDCYDVVGRVVSAVDGRPLGNARVESTPGATTYTDADGFFTVLSSGTTPNYFAYQTGFDIDGSLTGMPGAKYIEFGQVSEELNGLVRKPCSTSAPAAGAAPPGTKGGSRNNPVTIKVGAIGQEAYQATAIVSGGTGSSPGSILVTLEAGLPGPDGTLGNTTPTGGAKITLRGASGSALLTELAAGTYFFTAAGALTIEKGKAYQLELDVDGNGSVDGQGTVSVVGDLAFTVPAQGGSYLASTFTASWTDTGTTLGGPGYSALYQVQVSNAASTAAWFQLVSGLSAPAFNLFQSPPGPLPAGTYTANLTAFSGFASGPSSSFTQSNNITGVGISGTALSAGTATSVTFTLR
jgi:hypothetical protein